MKSLSAGILLVFFCLTGAMAQIPGIQEQPQWAIPFFFEDANGEWDTIWIGYDPSAEHGIGGYDSIYNEFQKIDTSRFVVVLNKGAYSPNMTLPADSAYKIDIQGNVFLYFPVGFLNGKMPVTMRWDNSKFYSDSLPPTFPNLHPAPRAKAIVSCNDLNPNYWNCPIDYEVLTLTDSIIPGMTYAYTDSLVLQGDTTWSPEESIYDLVIRIIPFDDFSYLGINNSQDELNIKVYPNPVSAELIMDNSQAQEVLVEVYRYDGGLIYISELHPLERRVLNVGDWPKGLYVVYLKMNNFIESHKILKV